MKLVFHYAAPRNDQIHLHLSSESAEEDAGMEPALAAPRSAPSEDGQKGGKGQIRLPAMTPRTPDLRVLDFNSFVMGYVLTFRVIPLGAVALIQVPG